MAGQAGSGTNRFNVQLIHEVGDLDELFRSRSLCLLRPNVGTLQSYELKRSIGVIGA